MVIRIGLRIIPWTALLPGLLYFEIIDRNESVDGLVAEIPRYHLTELTSLDLSFKELTSDEASRIIQAVVRQGASLKTLDLGW